MRLIKRTVDILGASLGLALCGPLMLLIALWVRLDSRGPVLYKPEVIGYNGHRFRLLKFRSMVMNAGEVLRSRPDLWNEYKLNLKVKNDPRITRVGRFLRKWSLDELPQFINVLRGDLSLVGPRILSEIELARYGGAKQEIIGVIPGLTGLWQVSGRHEVSLERRIELDLYYVRHQSLWLDLKILALTVPAVLGGRGAS